MNSPSGAKKCSKNMIGEEMSPILTGLECALMVHDEVEQGPPGFTEEGFRSILYLFSVALWEKVWLLSEKEGIPMEQRIDMASRAGEELRALLKTYTDIDTTKLYQ